MRSVTRRRYGALAGPKTKYIYNEQPATISSSRSMILPRGPSGLSQCRQCDKYRQCHAPACHSADSVGSLGWHRANILDPVSGERINRLALLNAKGQAAREARRGERQEEGEDEKEAQETFRPHTHTCRHMIGRSCSLEGM